MSKFNASAIGSDVARSEEQARLRDAANLLIEQMGLNGSSKFATEFVQALSPVATVETPQGPMYCRGGHGRLVWRAESFFEEEPDTIAWLDGMTRDDVLWDVGSNVGMYAVYAAKFSCGQVFAFEPEGQNYATLCENIAMNGIAANCRPVMVALFRETGFGELAIRYVTKGGAYNQFGVADDPAGGGPITEETEGLDAPSLRQVVYGVALDDLLDNPVFTPPTHLKVDVDGREADIFDGAAKLLRDRRLRGVLVEVNKSKARDVAIPDMLAGLGFRKTVERSNWDYRDDRSREDEYPTVNMIFQRG